VRARKSVLIRPDFVGRGKLQHFWQVVAILYIG
jgi:hypothetical protein